MLNAIAKLYYTITEVSKIIGEEQHVLRYWEREFPQLRPQKNRAGNRVYTDRDLTVLKVIQKLLRQERYTVAGAREYLKSNDVYAEIDTAIVEIPQNESTESKQVETQLLRPNNNDVADVVNELRSIAESLRASSKNNDD